MQRVKGEVSKSFGIQLGVRQRCVITIQFIYGWRDKRDESKG